MGDLGSFKKEILLATLASAVFAELISLVIVGPDRGFGAGLAAGTMTTMGSFLILARTGSMIDITNNSFPVIGGYFVRMLLYGAVFFFCIRTGILCGFGCLAGFITLHFGIVMLYSVVYRFILKKKNPLNDWTEPKEWNDLSEYDEEEDDW